MKNELAGSAKPPSKPRRRSRRWWVGVVGAAIVVMVIGAAVGYMLISRYMNSAGGDAHNEKVLTIDDLSSPDVGLNSNTSDGSVENLTKELRAKIDTQIAAKENPISTVNTLVAVLCSTANADRPTQCIDYITEFLNTKMDSLKLDSDEYGQPDELQIAYWRAQFYADLAYNYKLITGQEFRGSDGKPLDTANEQLKYVKLYLAIAQNPANWGEPQTNEADGRTGYRYDYSNADNFVAWRERLEAGGAR